jgi:hypothetical protein
MCSRTSQLYQKMEDPDFSNKLLYCEEWGIDALDRFLQNDHKGAMTSYTFSNQFLMELEAGRSYCDLEDFLNTLRVKLFHNHGSKNL